VHVINQSQISSAWLEALTLLLQEGGKATHMVVAIGSPSASEDERVRTALDTFIKERRESKTPIWPVSTVANTIFPAAFYRPDSPSARARLYELHAKAQALHKRLRNPDNYFDRLVAYPSVEGDPFNQLEYIVDRLINQRKPRKGGRGGALTSPYEVGLNIPGGDLRIQAPGRDRNTMGFPCMSHVSFTLDGDLLNLSALYRNQHFVSRAYGNYVGLSRLGKFIAREVGIQLGEVVCLATHADAEIDTFGKGNVETLIRDASGKAI